MRGWRRRKREEDLEREFQSHLELEAEERQDLNAARRAFGNTTRIKEEVREMWGYMSLDRLARDVRYSIRMMRRRPLFTAVAVLSLGIALGANTAVFSFVNAIVLKKLPVAGSQRLVLVRQQNEVFHIESCCFSYNFFRTLRKDDPDFEDLLALTTQEVNLTDQDQTERLQAEVVSGNYFQALGVHPAAGRLLDENDDQAEGSSPVCVIGYRLWQERFGGKFDVIGRRVLLNTEPFQIVGVSQRGFEGAALHEPHDIQIPASMVSKLVEHPRDSNAIAWAQLIAKLKPGVRREQAQSRLNAIGPQIQASAGIRMLQGHSDFLLRDGSQGIGSKKEQFGKPVLVLLLLVGAVLLVACANIAALLLVRSVERTREAGLRMAIGASRSALVRQFLVESMLLAVAGGIGGWILAQGLIRVLLDMLGSESEGLVREVRPDLTIFFFSIAVALASGVLFGVVPAWRASRADPLAAVHGSISANPGKRSLTSGLVIASQIALSLALLFCAGLFARTLGNLRAVDLGFHPENVVLLPIDLSRTLHRNQDAQGFFQELLRRASDLPETRAASLTTLSMLSGSMAIYSVGIPGYVPPNKLSPTAYFSIVSSGYFQTFGVPLLAGRDFTDDDRRGGERVVIVNEQLAKQYFGGDALGKLISFGPGKSRIVGVAGTTKFRYLREDPQPTMYTPVSQFSPQALTLQVRTSGAPAAAIERLRAIVSAMDPKVPIGEIKTMEMQIDQALARERLLAFLSALLGTVAVTLAAIGLYGVLSFSVTRRTREIGIRMSVGALRRRILVLFLSESLWIVSLGIAAGIPLALLCGRVTSSLLYGLQAQDARTAAAATMLLGLVAFAAAFIPAWRASRVDPMAALRYE